MRDIIKVALATREVKQLARMRARPEMIVRVRTMGDGEELEKKHNGLA